MVVSKYSASGNDFVIYHVFKKIDRSNIAKKLCDRFNGVGADGLIVLLPHEKYDFEWQFYNADGSVAEMCGNGSRAAAHYAYKNNLADKKMKFLTLAGVIEAEVEGNIVTSQLTPYKLIKDTFEEAGFEWKIYDTGVPHLVTITDIENFDKNLARKMREKYNANVNFAQMKDGNLYVRTYERGVEDETLACGTGMCASFLVARDKGLVASGVKLRPKSGEELEVMLKNDTLYFKGAVKNSFTAVLEEDERDFL
ncbi:diaminopimelate epimerase [Caminibacter pacificus]|uniref:Diaminopimelate epimerase n=1 Tax=Caminibacter pacificus TaxID=1424653 RepID=A0AAJ4RAU4_9BACT|nr:diaminopimelate epimerase [Caminibacter pacificus]QCI29187.1 diaminopimelate epimerase [Caminibacter pacificus]ROR38831.1 diaminopimelate epimerase [Caminibacter pacificus]